MRKLLAAAAAVTVGVAVLIPEAAAAAPSSGPRAICTALKTQNPEVYGFLESKPGGCVSSVASVGVEALMAGAFPSTASAIGNCKFLEANMFGGYPYAFYGQVNDPRFVAKNRAGCVRVLRALHTGQISPPPPPARG